MFFLSLLISILGPLAAGKLVERLRFRRVFRQLLALEGGKKEGVAERTTLALLGNPEKEVMGGWVAMVAVFTACMAIPTSALSLISFGILTAGLGLNRMLRHRKNLLEAGEVEAAKEAMRELLVSGSSERVEGMAQGLYDTKKEALQELAIQAMTSWGSSWAKGFLKEAENSEFYDVGTSARIARETLKRFLDSNEEGSIGHLTALRSRGRYWKRLGPALQQGSKMSFLLGAGESKTQSDKIHRAFAFQASLAGSFPDVFCLLCHTRGEIHQSDDWKYVQCRTCLEASNMLAGVRIVAGHIGPPVEPVLEEGILPMNLWNELENTARPIELDRIEVIKGAEINYDWALSSAIEALRNRFPDKNLNVEVNIDPAVKLNANTMNLVRSISNGLGSGLI